MAAELNVFEQKDRTVKEVQKPATTARQRAKYKDTVVSVSPFSGIRSLHGITVLYQITGLSSNEPPDKPQEDLSI